MKLTWIKVFNIFINYGTYIYANGKVAEVSKLAKIFFFTFCVYAHRAIKSREKRTVVRQCDLPTRLLACVREVYRDSCLQKLVGDAGG